MTTSDGLPNEYTLRSWFVVIGASLCLFCSVGFLNSFGIFEEYYASHQLSECSQSTIAWIGALSIFFLFAISVVSGAIVDIFGPRLLLCTGSVGLVFSAMMVSLCKAFYQFLLAQGVLLGISMALVVWPALAVVGQYIKRKRAAAMGIAIAGSSLGGVIWPIAINQMLKSPTLGFPWTMRIVGFIMIPLLAFTCIACRSPETSLAIKQGDSEKDTAPIRAIDRKAEARALFGRLSVQLLCLAMFIIYFGMFSPFFYTTSFATDKGFSEKLAFYTVSIVNGASFFGRIIPGIVADKYGKFNCCIIATIFAGIVALCWTKVESVAGLVIWCAAYGFASGGILSLQQACAAQVATPSTIGLAIGTVGGSTALSAMANVPISGALAEKYGYLSLSLYSGIALVLGGVLLIGARLSQNRKLLAVV